MTALSVSFVATQDQDEYPVRIVNVDDYQREAKRILPRDIYDYAAGGGFYELTENRNRAALQSVTLWPRYMRDVSNINTTLTVLGKAVKFPIGMSPSAFHAAYAEDGELATARACERLGNIYVMSYYATRLIEDVARVAPNCRKWMDIYLSINRTTTEEVVKRAKDAGFEALVVTIDGVNLGRRFRDHRNDLDMSARYPPANVPSSESAKVEASPRATWKDIQWLGEWSGLPVITKGVLHPLDAREAIKAGVAAIYVSNHGGRELDTTSPTIDALPDIVREVRREKRRKVEIYTDGGYREGVDAIKAFSVGAQYLFLGRPTVFMLAVNGTDALVDGYGMLHSELRDVMQLAGFPTLSKIPRALTKKCTGRGPGSRSGGQSEKPPNRGILGGFFGGSKPSTASGSGPTSGSSATTAQDDDECDDD